MAAPRKRLPGVRARPPARRPKKSSPPQLFDLPPVAYTLGVPFGYSPYPFLAMDTETTVVDLQREIPQLVLATITNGRQHLVVKAAELPEFIEKVLANDVVVFFQNLRFDWWAVAEELQKVGRGDLYARWLQLLDGGWLRDIMLVDFLLRLGDPANCSVIRNYGLGDLTAQYLGEKCDKTSPYRKRFGELLDVDDWTDPTLDPWFQYATRDTVFTHRIAAIQASRLQKYDAPPVRSWGRLTQGIQTKASVVLSEIGRNGFKVDGDQVGTVQIRLDDEIAGKVEYLCRLDPPIFQSYKAKKRLGELQRNKLTNVPKINQKSLRFHLMAAAATAEVAEETIPRTAKTGEVTTALDFWREAAPYSEMIAAWAEMQDLSKVRQFIGQLQGKDAVYTDYNTIVRTGRTSAKAPNIQQMPKKPWFRALFVAGCGNTLAIADYSAIELRTLAAVLMNRYETSVLADVLRRGVDPHVYTASLIMGLSYDAVRDAIAFEKAEVKAAEKAGKPRPPTPHMDGRQAAKAVNFGVPGGLGPIRLASYAHLTYGVDLSVEQAADFRHRLITDVYPEIGRYLEDDTAATLAENLHCTEAEVLDEMKPAFPGYWMAVQKVVSGKAVKVDGSPYSPGFRASIWAGLTRLCQNPLLTPRLIARDEGTQLRRLLFGQKVTTLTGRHRAGLDYGEARNTRFQGLAADGAKLALWDIWNAGYRRYAPSKGRIVAFIHDEVVVEVPLAGAEQAKEEISSLMVAAMKPVLLADIPVEVEAHLSPVWSK